MKTSKMIMGFAFIGLLLFFCSAVVAQSTSGADPAQGAEENSAVVFPDSNVPDGVGVLLGPTVIPVKKYLTKDGEKPGGPRVPPKPSYATANVTKVTLPNGGELQFKVPSELDGEPAYIDTGDPDTDKANHINALNDWFGYDEIYKSDK